MSDFKMGWDKARRFLSKLLSGANSWTGTQTFSNVVITSGTISGVTMAANFTTATNPALNAGTAKAIVDAYNGILITTSTTGNSQTLATPTAASIKYFTVSNNDTSTHTVPVVANSVTYTIAVGKSQTFVFDGSAWYPTDVGITAIPVTVIQGGTGLSTITDHSVMVGSGTGAVTPISVGATGEILCGSTGADPAWSTTTLTDGTNTFNIACGTASLDVATACVVDINANLTVGSAATISGTNTGDITLATDHGLGLTNQVLNMGTPSSVTGASTNSVTTTTHTHAIDLSASKIAGAVNGWTQTTGTFTATPASTSTITMTSDLTASILVGYPLKYAIGGVTYFGICTAIAANLLTVAGAPLGGDVTALYYGDPLKVSQMVINIPSTYEDATSTGLIAADLSMNVLWQKTKSYLVKYTMWSLTHDSGTHGQASVTINGTEVNTTAGGLTIAADATLYSTVVDIATAAYDINTGEAIEITSVKAGNGDATSLTATLIFVTP